MRKLLVLGSVLYCTVGVGIGEANIDYLSYYKEKTRHGNKYEKAFVYPYGEESNFDDEEDGDTGQLWSDGWGEGE